MTRLDKAYLWRWNKSLHVRQLQKPMGDLLREAESKQVSPEEILKEQGHTDQTGRPDWSSFFTRCPQFPLSCRPLELAELGSGFVLYFFLLKFMMCIMVVYVLLQIPVWYVYSKSNNLDKFVIDAQSNNDDPAGCPTGDVSTKAGLTPGSLGYQSARGTGDYVWIPVIYAVGGWIFAIWLAVHNQIQIAIDQVVDHNVTEPGDFAVLVEGLAPSVLNEGVVKDFFEEHACVDEKGKPRRVKVVKVVMNYESGWVTSKIKELRDLHVKITQLSEPDGGPLHQQAQGIDAELTQWKDARTGQNQLRATGAAIVIFAEQKDRQGCLKRWSSFWGQRGYELPSTSDQCCCFSCCVQYCCCWCSLKPLPSFPVAGGWSALKVKAAPHPTDINWEGLGKPPCDRFKRRAVTVVASALVLLCAFAAIVGLTRANIQQANDIKAKGGYQKNKFRSGLYGAMVAALIIINLIQVFVIRWFGSREYHNTRTESFSSQNFYLSISMFINSSLVLLALNSQSCEWYADSRLVDAMTTKMAVNIFMPLLTPVLDFEHLYKWIRRRLSFPLEEINADLEKYRNPQTPKARAAWQHAEEKADAVKEIFTPPEFDLAYEYAWGQCTFFTSLFFMPLIPLAALMGFLSLAVQYLVDKFLLLRYYRMPLVRMNSRLAINSLQNLRFVGLLLSPFTVLLFLTPSWQSSDDSIPLSFFFMVVPAIIICLVPLGALGNCCCPKFWLGCVKSHAAAAEQTEVDIEDYYNAQNLWAEDAKYHRSQPVYKLAIEEMNPENFTEGAVPLLKVQDLFTCGRAELAAEKAVQAMEDGVLRARPASTMAGHAGVLLPIREPVAPYIMATSPQPMPQPVQPPMPPASGWQLAPVTPSPAPVKPYVPGAAVQLTYAEPAAAYVPVAAVPVTYGQPAAAYVPGLTVPSQPHAVWEFEAEGGFKPFGNDCQAEVEQKFQEYQRGGPARVQVSTNGLLVSIDYRLLTQMVGSGRKRKIRRHEPDCSF